MTERLDKVLTMNEVLADRVTELERKLADQAPATGVGAPGRRIDEREAVTRQTDRKHAAGIAGNALGLVAAVIALSRKRTEDKNDGHRAQG